MGGALRTGSTAANDASSPTAAAAAYAVKSASASSPKGKSTTSSSTVVPVTLDPLVPLTPAELDALLDKEEELEAKRQEEMAQRQKAAVTHVVDNLFPYAPVKVETHKYPASSSGNKRNKAYLWITVDEDEIKRKGGTSSSSPVRYPIGVAVDEEGNVFVSDTPSNGNGMDANGEFKQSRKITAESIIQLATNKEVPVPPKPPKLVMATQTSLTVRWKRSPDTTVDRYEVQYRLADSPNNAWATLITVLMNKDVSLDNISCHTPYEFRVRAHNPAGWSDYSAASPVVWTLAGIPSRPNPPVAGAVADSYISMFWSPCRDNGAAPVTYKLECRENDGNQRTNFQFVYEGRNCGFVVGHLKAKTPYVFRLQASNAVGTTEFAECKPIKTLAHPRPEIVELSRDEQSSLYDRWVQCWDPKTEQIFYFNRYTCQRVTQEPDEVAQARSQHGLTTVEETPEMIFRRKRFRFHRELRQNMTGINTSTSLPLELNRETMFEDTFRAFQRYTKQDLVAKPKISFLNEAGIDSGGLTKDWFLQISKLAVDKKRNLLKGCDQGQYELHAKSAIGNPQHLQYFKFLGKFMAKTIFDRQTMDLPLCDGVLKHFLHQKPTMDDLKAMDSQYHKSLIWMLENDIADVIDETFSVLVEDAKGKSIVMDLKENGRDIPVTDLNKKEYIDLMLQWRTEFGVKSQLDALLQGFGALIPLPSLQVFELPEFRMLLNGKPSIDVEELRANTVFQGGYNEHSQVILWLWQALREFSQELRGLFLKFMTGTNKIPLDGFDPPLNLTKSDLDPQALPRTHTCFNQLVLPEYTSYETLVHKITYAIKNAEGFDLS